MRQSLMTPLLLFAFAHALKLDPNVVPTTAGPVKGQLEGSVRTWRGIPYAAPPVGALRWQNPTPHAPWGDAPRPALSDAPGCPQTCTLPSLACPPRLSEDCLALNVFAPANATASSKLPVMFWIHGGNFYQGYGGGALYDGSSFAMNHNIVLVSINYRLGALGFLYTGDDAATQLTGNFGLRDQQAAMRWVRDNIGGFGGDAGSVTVFGQSAGAMSIAAHLTMPSSSGLFHRAILESEPFGLPFRTAVKYPAFSRTVATKANCTGPLHLKKNFVPCLRGLDWQSVVLAQDAAQKALLPELGHFLNLFVPYSPVVGVPELLEQPLAGIVHGRVHDVPIVVGSVRDEATLFVYEAFPTKAVPAIEEDALLALIYGVGDAVKILKQYPRTATDKAAKDMRNHSAVYVTDSLFHCATRHGLLQLAEQHDAGNRTAPGPFGYHFDHIISFGAKFWNSNPANPSPECINAVCHAEELPFVFNPDVAIVNASFTDAERTLSDSMQTYWSNFAKSGDSPGSFAGLQWPAMNGKTQSTMLFSTASVSKAGNVVQQQAYSDKCAFWDKLGYEWVLKA